MMGWWWWWWWWWWKVDKHRSWVSQSCEWADGDRISLTLHLLRCILTITWCSHLLHCYCRSLRVHLDITAQHKRAEWHTCEYSFYSRSVSVGLYKTRHLYRSWLQSFASSQSTLLDDWTLVWTDSRWKHLHALRLDQKLWDIDSVCLIK